MSPMHKQRGVIAVIAALSLLAFIAMAGLVLDLGRLFIIKAELQGAADSCVLSAARELNNASDSLLRATNAGIQVGVRNSADLQSAMVKVEPSDVTFSPTLTGAYVPAVLTTPSAVKYVKCRPQAVSAEMWFMKVIGVTNRVVSAEAIARLAASQATCATPVGLCTTQTSKNTPQPNWGLKAGDWYSGIFAPGAGMTGSFNWIDFNPPNGGANELKDMIAGNGACNVPVSGLVGQSGYNSGLVDAWNTRFGIYKGSYDVDTNRPDWTGFAYTGTSWTAERNAYGDFATKRISLAPYQGDGASGVSTGSGKSVATSVQHGSYGADRRLALVPVVRCLDWLSGQTIEMRDWACVLLLNPVSTPSDIKLEFLGLTSDPSSPCATAGIPGGLNTKGPLVPTLVQ
ncbi:MAG TPA: pilus assembly protein TadG-related protein [Burkholderiales bacterium]|nr:pilus assembly protein TadG-related protein [Burkholderiales bacterium]